MTGRQLVFVSTVVLAAGAAGSARQPSTVRMLSMTASGPTAATAAGRVATLVDEGRLRVTRVHQDTMMPGRVHERLSQHHEGLPVFGAGIVRQVENGVVRSVFGRTYEGIGVATYPAVAAADAARLAVNAIGSAGVSSGTPSLGILPLPDQYALAWKVPVRGLRAIEDVFVDAGTGVVLRRRSRIRRQFGDIGRGRGVFGDDRKVIARRTTGGFETHDALRPGPLETYDFVGSPDRLGALISRGVLNPGDLARDADNVWTDGAVVDAHVYQGYAYDYFFKRFARRGMDDADGTVTTIVHPLARADADEYHPDDVDQFINNALYVGGRTLIFGDGDGREFDYFSGSLDVVAHEWTHGVTDYGAGFTYEDESGALDESFADVMGTAAEFMFEEAGSGRGRADWLIGEDVARTGGPLRSMSDPVSAFQPDHYSLRGFIGTDIDNGGVHFNSGIPNHAFYLAVAGGRNRVSGLTVQGVGLANIERMERIFYRAFVFFLTPDSRFSDARAATLAAAAELYGESSDEWLQLRQAWTAVGVN